MNHSACTQLDDYLAGALGGGVAPAFESHLDECATCRQAVDEHREMVRLLARGMETAEPVPALLMARTERAMRWGDRRRRLRLAGGLATAAVIVIGVGIALRTGPPPEPDATDTQVIAAAPDVSIETVEPTPSAKSLVRVTLLNPDEAIAVPVETKSPNVSIVFIYPTVKVASADTMPPNDTLPTEPIISE